jgi:pimeloyl-ACP methyl ester carboxylesterase
MSLSPEEYREHLATTAVRAGFSFDESQVVLPQSREFHLGRMRFHYLDWGNKNLPTIVFLHGGALTAHTWDPSASRCATTHCLALDQRGHGDSDWAADGDYSIGAALDTKACRPPRPRQVHSGRHVAGAITRSLAVAHPERLSHLVIIDAGPEMRRPGSSRIRDFVPRCRRPSRSRRSSRRRSIQPAARPEDPAPQPDA